MNSKYIFVTGGTLSPGDMANVSSSLACLLKARGFRVAIMNLAPYLNSDSATLNPDRYGECYVTADGTEVPYTLGIYERFTEEHADRHSHATLGNILQSVTNKERRGDYDGERVQLTPHVTNEIERRITEFAQSGQRDFVIVEISECTPSDIGAWPFFEAMRRLRYKLQPEDSCCVHLTRTGDCAAAQLRHLLSAGIQPNAMVALTEPDDRHCEDTMERIGQSGNLRPGAIFGLPVDACAYEIPTILFRRAVDQAVLRMLGVDPGEADMTPWFSLRNKIGCAADNGKIDVGYLRNDASCDTAHASLREALQIAAIHGGCAIDFHPLSAQNINRNNVADLLNRMDGIILPHGYDDSEEEGSIAALKWCRENDVPTLGIGRGMQYMVKEFARNVMHISDTNDLISPESTRTGAFDCDLSSGSCAAEIYSNASIRSERHSHSFEINKDYRQRLAQAGMQCSGEAPRTHLIEIIEIPNLRRYIGTIFNPEYSSTILTPNPIFTDFISQAINYHNVKNQNG